MVSSGSKCDVSTSIVSPIPTPTYGSYGSFSLLSTATIAAPPSACFAAAVDTSSWPQWNTFMQAGVIKSRPEGTGSAPKPGELTAGTVFRETSYLDGHEKGKPSSNDIKITACGELADGRKGFCVAWIFVNKSFLYRSERVQEFVETKDLETAFRDWITFGGASGWLLKLMFGAKLAARWNDYGRDLKQLLKSDGSKPPGA